MSGSPDYTTTPNLALFKPISNRATGTWGDLWNSNADKLDATMANLSGGPFLPIAGGTMTGAVVLAGISTAPTAVPGTNTLQLANTAFVAAATATANHNVGRNLLHNPLFNIAQRGMGSWSTNVYTLDRWLLGTTLDTGVGINQAVLSPAQRGQIGDEQAIYCLNASFTGNAGASACTQITQKIENVWRLSGKTITVSFWANSTANNKIGVSWDQVFGTGGSPPAPVVGAGQAVTTSGTLTRYSVSFVLPSTLSATVGTNNDHCTQLNFWYSSGATQATRAGNIGVQSGTVNIWGVQLEIGNVATPLEKPDPRYDLSNCQRFYQTILASMNTYGAAGNAFGYTAPWAVPMRAAPTVSINGQTYINASGMAVSSNVPNSFTTWANPTATGSAAYSGALSASADL